MVRVNPTQTPEVVVPNSVAPAHVLIYLVLSFYAVGLHAEQPREKVASEQSEADSRRQQFRRLALEAAEATGLPASLVPAADADAPAAKLQGRSDSATFRKRALEAAKNQRADSEASIKALIEAIADERGTDKAFDDAVDAHHEAAVVAVLAEALQMDSREMRCFAGRHLGELGYSARIVIVELVKALQDEHEHVRSLVASALGDIGPEARSAVPALIAGLADPSSHVRASASEALGKIRAQAKQAVPALIAALQDEDDHVRFMTVGALGEFGSHAAAAAEPLRKTLLHDPDSHVRWHATAPLAAVDPEGKIAIPTLIEGLPSRDANMRRFAAMALGTFGPQAKGAVPLLSVGLNDKDTGARIAAAGALWRVNGNSDDTVPVLVRVLEQEVGIAHYWAATELARMGPNAKEAVPALRKSMAKALWPDAPAHALGNIGKDAATAVPDLVELLESKKTEVRACAAAALWKINRHPRALPTLREELKEPGPYRAAIAAGEIGPDAKVCVPGLLTALHDQELYVRRAAAKALAKVQPSAAPELP